MIAVCTDTLSRNRRRILVGGLSLLGTTLSPITSAYGRRPDVDLSSLQRGEAQVRAAPHVFESVVSLRQFRRPDLAAGRTLVVALANYYAGAAGGGGLFRWQANSNQADDGGYVVNTVNSSGAGRWIRIGDGISTPLEFGAKGDSGVTDDSVAVSAWLDHLVSTGKIGDGNNKTYRVRNIKNIAPTRQFHLRNVQFISGSSFSDQFTLRLNGDVDYLFENISCDGERSARSNEPWRVFSSMSGYRSIYPTTAPFISSNGAATAFTKSFTFKNVNLTNLHGSSGLEISTVGVVKIDGLSTKNLSNRAYSITHDAATHAGTTIASNINTLDTGLLPEKFLVDGAARTRADAYAPQAAFNGNVSYGHYFVRNYRCVNYGSCGITANINRVFEASNVHIENNDASAFSNNPSGAFWIENCAQSTVEGVRIKITARDNREAMLDSSALQAFLGANAKAVVSDLDITCTTANIRKGVRGSNENAAVFRINTASIVTAGPASVDIANLPGHANAAEVSLAAVSASGPVRVRDCELTRISEPRFSSSLTLGANINKGGDIAMKGGLVTGPASVTGCDKTLSVVGTRFSSDLMIAQWGSSQTRRVDLEACRIAGVTTIAGALQSQVTRCITGRRIEFGNFETVTLAGNTLRTDRAEPVVWFNPPARNANARAVVSGNSLRSKSGTVGADYISWNANVAAESVQDMDNDKAMESWIRD